MFANVKGMRFPVVSNVYSTRERLAEVIGIKPLRSVRTAMKSRSPMTDEMEGWELRERIKAIELRSEQLESFCWSD